MKTLKFTSVTGRLSELMQPEPQPTKRTRRIQTNYAPTGRDLFAHVETEWCNVGGHRVQRVANLTPIAGAVPTKNNPQPTAATFNGLEANIQPADYPKPQHSRPLLIVALGMGTDSVAMLIEMRNRGIRPDVVQWADTGSERAHTYRYINVMIDWLKANDFPPLLIVRKRCPRAGHRSLFEQLWNTEQLPSPAFHKNHSCSVKWKLEPQRDYHSFLTWMNGSETTAVGFSAEETSRQIHREAVGFSADETGRRSYQITDDDGYQTIYFLQEWNLTRSDCVALIDDEGLPQPGKSACFVCPMSQLCEVRSMQPSNQAAAFALEQRAEDGGKLKSVRGLRKGVNQTWPEWMESGEESKEFSGLAHTV